MSEIPKAIGVSRIADNEQALLVHFRRALTDDELRAVHEFLAGRADTWIDEELKDGDRICEAAGVQRTEGGRLPVAKIINRLSTAVPEALKPVAWIWHYRDGHRSLRWDAEQRDWNHSDVPERSTPLYLLGAMNNSSGGAK